MCLRLGWTQAPTASLGCLLLSFLGIDFLFLQRYPPDALGLHPPSLANLKKKKKRKIKVISFVIIQKQSQSQLSSLGLLIQRPPLTRSP